MAYVLSRVVSVRVPAHWKGCVTSELAREWVLAWLREPVSFTENPPPSKQRLTIRFTEAEYRALSKLPGRSTSSAIRRIIALHISGKEPPGSKWLSLVFGTITVLLSLFSGIEKGVGQPGGQKP